MSKEMVGAVMEPEPACEGTDHGMLQQNLACYGTDNYISRNRP